MQTISTLNPWQLLLWIVGLELLSLPLIVGGINSAFNGYFKAKEQHVGKLAKAIGDSLTEAAKTMIKKKEEDVQ